MDDCRRALIPSAIAAVLLACSVAGTTAGDLGRPDPASGPPQPFAAHGTLSISVTDEEREMHDRLWRFLQLPLGPGRVATLGGSGRPVDPESGQAGYWRWLAGTPFASARARYTRLADDVQADLGTLPAAFRSACAVQEIDRQRLVAARGLDDIEAAMLAAVGRRVAENAEDVARFTVALGWRLDAYSYALDHLLVDAPYDDAVAVDAALADLEVYVAHAERGRFCEAPSGPVPPPRHGMAPLEPEPPRPAH